MNYLKYELVKNQSPYDEYEIYSNILNLFDPDDYVDTIIDYMVKGNLIMISLDQLITVCLNEKAILSTF